VYTDFVMNVVSSRTCCRGKLALIL